MNPPNPNQKRRLIPRWRTSTSTLELGELHPLESRSAFAPDDLLELNRRLEEWRTKGGLAHAADAVTSGFMLGKENLVEEPAKYILRLGGSVPGGALRIARRVLGEADTPGVECSEAEDGPDEELKRSISSTRRTLTIDPRNVLLWADLALLYTRSGQKLKAERAMRAATFLAPEHRFILRSAARLFMHLDRPDIAHDLLARAPALQLDPWLLAAEISTADAMKRPSRFLKRGRWIVESGKFEPRDVSELAGTLATEEFSAGSAKKARKLFEESIRRPTDNALAQAVWANRDNLGLGIPEVLVEQTPRSFEARARRSWQTSDWRGAIAASHAWLSDEPFSTRPAALGSYLASVSMLDYPAGAQFARVGLKANPQDFLMTNNLAFALAQSGKGLEARHVFNRINPRTVEGPGNRIIWNATAGLVAFRTGNASEGRRLYSDAASLAQKEGDIVKRGLALTYHALEEARLAGRVPAALKLEAMKTLNHLRLADLEALRHLLEKTPS